MNYSFLHGQNALSVPKPIRDLSLLDDVTKLKIGMLSFHWTH